jgi:glycosyltransferase involved in cell wall biosynthesis
MKINIIIPMYNEESRIEHTLSNLLNFLETTPKELDIKVYIVNDGSTDKSVKIVSNFIRKNSNINSNINLLTYPANRGKGYAFKYGVINSRSADYFYLADADNAAPWDMVYRFVEIAQTQKADVVIASRSNRNSEITRSFNKTVLNKLSNLIVRIILNLNFSDTQCGYKLFSSKCLNVIESLEIEKFGFDFELLKKLSVANYKIIEAPIIWKDMEGSKVKLSDYFKTVSELFRVRRIVG